MGSAYQFHSWRVFVLVCAFPSVFAIGALTTQPESPRFFLEVTGLRPSCGVGVGSARAPGSSTAAALVRSYAAAFLPRRVRSLRDFSSLPLLERTSRRGLQKGPLGWRSEGICSTMGGLKLCRRDRGPGPPTISRCSRLRSCPFSAHVLACRGHLPCFEFSLPLDQGVPRTYGRICLPQLLPTNDDIVLCPRLGLFPSG